MPGAAVAKATVAAQATALGAAAAKAAVVAKAENRISFKDQVQSQRISTIFGPQVRPNDTKKLLLVRRWGRLGGCASSRQDHGWQLAKIIDSI